MRPSAKGRRRPSAMREALAAVWICLALASSRALCVAQEPRNHAAGTPYRVEPAPADSYADDTGPQKHAADAAYRGELTDGVTGPPDYRAAEWVGWRDTSYTEPIRVTVDLGEPTWIDRIEVTCCGGGDRIEPPERIDVAMLDGSFPYHTFVQIAQMISDEEYVEGEARTYRFSLDDCRCTATQVRLDFHERTWSYLFVDEVRILGGAPGEASILPVQDLLLEAEDGEVVGGSVEAPEGAHGKAVLLDEAPEALRFELPLPAGDYTVRIRSLAKAPDTFGELLPHLGDQPMRAQPVTSNVFTWQRSHFTQAQDGPARISLSLGEGEGVYVDRVRIHSLTLNEPIAELCAFEPDTQLTDGGESRCLIVSDDHEQFAEQAATLASEIEKRSGARPGLKRGTDVTEEDFRTHHLIALGDGYSNLAILKASPNAWRHIPEAPEDGGPQAFVEVDPKGAGRNVIVVGGKSADQVEASIAAFLDRLDGAETLVLPWTQIPPPRLDTGRDRYKELAVESSRWLREGAIRTLENQWKAYGDDVFRMLGYRYIEYKDSADTIRPISRDGFIEAELFKIIARFDRTEHNGSLDRLERLQLTNTLLHMAEQCAGIFDWELCGRAYHPTDEVTRILTERQPTIANNHQTFPIYSLLTQGEYFARCYGLPEADRWLRWAEMAMQGQLLTSKPQCDCWGYQDITMTHTARYAAATGRWSYFEQNPVHQFLTLRFISHDNLGSGVGYGDVGAYRPPTGGNVKEENAGNWLAATAGRFDLGRIDRNRLLGVYVHPLEPMWYEFYGTDAEVPLDRCFDKITFRNAIDPQQAYLILDGLSRGYHGHWDGNSILRFTDNGRMWLCEGDYLKGDPKDHNTLTFMRNGESARPGLFSELRCKLESPHWASTVTRTPDYSSLDWDRHILWHRPTDTFMLFDEMTAREPGTYDMKARFRSLGETELEGRVWTVQQQGGQAFRLHAPGEGRLSEASDPEDAKNWQSYEHADSVPRLLHHRLTRQMAPGDRAVLPCLFYAAGDGDRLTTARALPPNAMVTQGRFEIIAGAGDLSTAGLTARATHFALGPEDVVMVQGAELSTHEPLLKATARVSIALDLGAGTGVIEADQTATLSVLARDLSLDGARVGVPADGLADLVVSPGRHTLAGDFSPIAQALARAHNQAWQAAGELEQRPPAPKPTHGIAAVFRVELPAEITALAPADLTGDGAPEFVAGCADGTLAAVDSAGNELWRHQFAAQVNDLAAVDLDGDGRDEVTCGVEDEHLHVLKPDGTDLWKRFFEAHRAQGGIEGHPRVVMAADFEGDGTPEIAVGGANSIFYVLDAQGNTKQSKGQPWEVITQHKASAIGAADVTGDGQLELFCGYTYFGRRIADFADTGRTRVSNLGGCISGCGAIASADVDGDGLPEAIFADKDGQTTACRKAKQPEARGVPAEIVWQKMIGDDAVSAVEAADVDGDGRAEIILGSHSGFVALLNADGSVRWIRYADNQVTDVALIADRGGQIGLARSSADGSVVVYDASGEELARWNVEVPVQRLITARADARPVLVVVAGRELRAGIREGG